MGAVVAGDPIQSSELPVRDGWPRRGFAARPVSIPDDFDRPAAAKVSGVVVLPRHVRWSEPQRQYDLDDPKDRLSVYEQVLQEGTDDDVRDLIDVEVLIAMWDTLVLPERVRRAWADWLRGRRGLDLAC